MSSLYELVEKQNRILEELLRNGEETEEINKALTELQIDLPEKVSSYKHLMDRLRAEAEFFSDEASKYSAAAKALEKAQDRIKNRLKDIMMTQKITELEGTDVVFKLSKTKGSVQITNEELIPKEYVKTVTLQSIDKVRVGEDLSAGVPVPGAFLAESYALKPYVRKGKK